MSSVLRALAVLVTLTLASACTEITTSIPVGTSHGGPLDMRLVGAWHAEPVKSAPSDEQFEQFDVLISPSNDGTALQAIDVDVKTGDWEVYTLVTGRIGDLTFASIRRLTHNGVSAEMPGHSSYWPLVYRFDADGSVRVFDRSDEGAKSVADAIVNEIIAGESIGDESAHITTDPATLDAFFGQMGTTVLNEPSFMLRPLKH